MSVPLHGKKVIVTRDKQGAELFSEKILQYGGFPIEVPLLTIQCENRLENKKTFDDINRYKWIFFTSANGVECFFKLATTYQFSFDSLKLLKIATVGHKTEEKLKEYGFSADFIPTTYNADTMAREFLLTYPEPGLILLVRGNLSRDVLPKELSKVEQPFDTVTVYKTIVNKTSKSMLNHVLDNDFDFLTFTSPSAVDAFHSMTERHVFKPCFCIGTTTEERAKELGFKNIVTPKNEFTIDAMIQSMEEYITMKE